jgi:hypothetical protein
MVLNEEKTKTITIDNVEYELDSLDSNELYFIKQINDIKDESSTLKIKLDRLIMSENGFISALKGSLNAKDNDSKEQSE